MQLVKVPLFPPSPSQFVLCVHAKLLSYILLFATLWTMACQAPLTVGFSKQEYWSGLPCPPSGDLPDPRIELKSLTSPALVTHLFDSLGSRHREEEVLPKDTKLIGARTHT